MKSSRENKKRQIKKILCKSPEETQQVGAALAKALPVPGIVLLRGNLGAGKTTLTRGIAQGLGMRDPDHVNSPSFTLINIYQGRCPIYHVDLYRLEGERDLYSIGLDEFIGNEGITIVEWSERLSHEFENAAEIEIEDAGENSRILHVRLPAKSKGKRRRKETSE
jgi:tRNA threonylcarbamoyladenosine biosynthesis protein TsaE